MTDIGVWMSADVLSHKLEAKQDQNPEEVWNLSRWPTRFNDDEGKHRLFVARRDDMPSERRSSHDPVAVVFQKMAEYFEVICATIAPVALNVWPRVALCNRSGGSQISHVVYSPLCETIRAWIKWMQARRRKL